MRVGPQQANRPDTAPASKREVLVFGLDVGRGELEDRWRAIRRAHGHHG